MTLQMKKQSLSQALKARHKGILIGAGVCPRSLQEPYLSKLKNSFDCWQATSGYKLHSAIAPGIYDFSMRDEFLSKIPPKTLNRAGCLIWRFGWSGWLSKLPSIEQRWEYLEYWMAFLLHPEPWALDVCNEVLNHCGQPFNKFEVFLGKDWIYKIFNLARKICPSSKLFLCQNFLRNDAVWDGVRREVSILRDRGIDVNVSIQAHSTIQGTMNYGTVLDKRLRDLKRLNCEIHVSEVACWIWRWNKGKISPGLQPFLKAEQQKAYHLWLQIAKDNGVKLFAVWSPFDDLSWHYMYPDQLGIFDSNLRWWD